MQHSVCGIHFSSCGTVHVDSRWQWKSQVKSYISENDPESTFIDFSVDIWLLGSYEDSMFTYGTPRTQRAHFQSILRPLARVVFSAILVPSDVCDNSKICGHARYLSTRPLSQTVVWRRMPLVTLANGLIRCLRRRSSPLVSKLVKNWSLWTEKCPRPWWWHFLLCDFGFYEFVFKPIHGYVGNFLGNVGQMTCQLIGLSANSPV